MLLMLAFAHLLITSMGAAMRARAHVTRSQRFLIDGRQPASAAPPPCERALLSLMMISPVAAASLYYTISFAAIYIMALLH